MSLIVEEIDTDAVTISPKFTVGIVGTSIVTSISLTSPGIRLP